MAEDFETALARALAPLEREPDRAFVGRVQAAILLEERLAMERWTLFSALATQLLALAALAAAMLFLTRASAVVAWVERSPDAAIASLTLAVGLFVLLIGAWPASRRQGGAFTLLNGS